MNRITLKKKGTIKMKVLSAFDRFLRKRPLFKGVASVAMPGLALFALQGIVVQKAYAHHPIVSSAIPSCSNGKIVISFTITSWDVGSTMAPGDGENSNVEVFFNGGPLPNGVATGAFVDPTDSFSGVVDAPLGVTTVDVSALALATWGDGYPGGQNSDDYGTSATVDLTNVGPCTPPPGNGRFTGGGKVVVSDAIVPAGGEVTVTKGFEVECDLDPAHENLELNWTGGNHFHMDKMTSAVCTLSGTAPNPPSAPVNRIDATGTGSYNGTDGYTVVFTLWDHGEPGVNDQAGFVVCQTDPANPKNCSTSPNIVLSIPLQDVTTGNIQAHVDQQ